MCTKAEQKYETVANLRYYSTKGSWGISMSINLSVAYPVGALSSPPPLKYKLIYSISPVSGTAKTGHLRTRWPFSGLHLILDVGRRDEFFFYLHFILGGKLDVERREDLFFWSSSIFSVETQTGNCGPPPFQISEHTPELIVLLGHIPVGYCDTARKINDILFQCNHRLIHHHFFISFH